MTKNKIEKIFKILSKQISNPKTELTYKNPYTFLVSVVLSAQATDKSVNASTVKLFKIIKRPEEMIKLYEEKDKNSQVWLNLQIQKSNLLDDRIKLYDDLVKEVKPKWYENKWLWFSLGVITTAGSIKIAGELVD